MKRSQTPIHEYKLFEEHLILLKSNKISNMKKGYLLGVKGLQKFLLKIWMQMKSVGKKRC